MTTHTHTHTNARTRTHTHTRAHTHTHTHTHTGKESRGVTEICICTGPLRVRNSRKLERKPLAHLKEHSRVCGVLRIFWLVHKFVPRTINHQRHASTKNCCVKSMSTPSWQTTVGGRGGLVTSNCSASSQVCFVTYFWSACLLVPVRTLHKLGISFLKTKSVCPQLETNIFVRQANFTDSYSTSESMEASTKPRTRSVPQKQD